MKARKIVHTRQRKAAAITSYARMRLWKLMDAIVQLGGDIFSCDTDSITTNLDLSKHPSLLNEFIPDWRTESVSQSTAGAKLEENGRIEPVDVGKPLPGAASGPRIPTESTGRSAGEAEK